MLMVMGTSTIIGFVLTGFAQTSLSTQLLPERVVLQSTFPVATKPSERPVVPPELLPPGLEELIETSCRDVPSGIGIPGFQPGIHKNDVIRMLGAPTISSSGYWPNTRAVSYELVPDRVSLGFLFDRNSEKIRQTEAAFTTAVDTQVILLTLNGMLGCKLSEPIRQGLEKVQQRQSRQYSFSIGQLKGVIERDRRDRIYIGIWERDLHR